MLFYWVTYFSFLKFFEFMILVPKLFNDLSAPSIFFFVQCFSHFCVTGFAILIHFNFIFMCLETYKILEFAYLCVGNDFGECLCHLEM